MGDTVRAILVLGTSTWQGPQGSGGYWEEGIHTGHLPSWPGPCWTAVSWACGLWVTAPMDACGD
jgi:hypothetical protein